MPVTTSKFPVLPRKGKYLSGKWIIRFALWYNKGKAWWVYTKTMESSKYPTTVRLSLNGAFSQNKQIAENIPILNSCLKIWILYLSKQSWHTSLND